MIASQNEQSAMRLRAQLAQQSGSLPVIGRELVQARAVEAQALAQRMKDLADLDELVRIDPRYVAPLRGLFSDVSAFLRLFQDPREGPGQWLLAIVGGLVLFCLECIALLALALSPSSALDVMRQQRNRAMAAMIVAEAELSMAQSRARMANPPESASVPIEAAGTWRKGVSQP